MARELEEVKGNSLIKVFLKVQVLPFAFGHMLAKSVKYRLTARKDEQ